MREGQRGWGSRGNQGEEGGGRGAQTSIVWEEKLKLSTQPTDRETERKGRREEGRRGERERLLRNKKEAGREGVSKGALERVEKILSRVERTCNTMLPNPKHDKH